MPRRTMRVSSLLEKLSDILQEVVPGSCVEPQLADVAASPAATFQQMVKSGATKVDVSIKLDGTH